MTDPGSCGTYTYTYYTSSDCLLYDPPETKCIREHNGECLEWQYKTCVEWEPKEIAYTKDVDYCRYKLFKQEYISPIVDQCQDNFAVIISDGAPTARTGYPLVWSDTDTRTFINQFPLDDPTAAPELASSNEVQTYCDAVDAITGTNTELIGQIQQAGRCGPELAKLLFENDLSLTLDGQQNVKTYTIGLSLSSEPETEAFLRTMAEAGGGQYFSADTAADLAQQLQMTFENIADQVENTSFAAAATTLGSRLQHGKTVYIPVFQPSNNARWIGNVKGYRIDPSKSVLQDINDTDATDSSGKVFLDSAQSLWSATPDGNDVAAGGMASRLAIRNTTGGRAKAYTYTGATPPSNVDLTLANNALTEDNTSITTTMLGIANDAQTRSKLLQWARGIDVNDEEYPFEGVA